MSSIRKSLIIFLVLSLPAAARAEYQAEIMSMEGQVSVIDAQGASTPAKEGQILTAPSTVETGAASHADLAFDRDWKNVVRVEENSQMKIRAIYPTDVALSRGGLFAKLKALPPDSTFEVQTPTAIASVRGTEYRTVHSEAAGTEVFSFSDSPVYVFGLDDQGKLSGQPTTLAQEEKTSVLRRGDVPVKPLRMAAQERKIGFDHRASIGKKADTLRKAGRFGKVQNIDLVRRELKERRRLQPKSSEQNFGPKLPGHQQAVERAKGSQKERMQKQEGRRDEQRKKGKRKKPSPPPGGPSGP